VVFVDVRLLFTSLSRMGQPRLFSLCSELFRSRMLLSERWDLCSKRWFNAHPICQKWLIIQ